MPWYNNPNIRRSAPLVMAVTMILSLLVHPEREKQSWDWMKEQQKQRSMKEKY